MDSDKPAREGGLFSCFSFSCFKGHDSDAPPEQPPLPPVLLEPRRAGGGLPLLSIPPGTELPRATIGRTSRLYLSSSTPLDELPKSWEEWDRRYGRGEIDIQDPPPPPARAYLPLSGEAVLPTPFEVQAYYPPLPPWEHDRQRAVDRLGLTTSPYAPYSSPFSPPPSTFRHSTAPTPLATQGRRSSLPSTLSSLHPPPLLRQQSLPLPSSTASLQQHPALRALVDRARRTFGSHAAVISVQDRERIVYLAASGIPDWTERVGRRVWMGSHTVLNGEKGFVLLDSRNDWRFANSVPAVELGVQFYAGYPIVAPPSPDDPAAPRLPIGSLCIIDTTPRLEFSSADRQRLAQMAKQASYEIANWSQARYEAKIARMDSGMKQWEAGTASSGPSRPSSWASSPGRPPLPPLQTTFTDAPLTPPHSPSFPSDLPFVPDLAGALQKVFDLATSLIRDNLGLSLVYLIAISLPPKSPSSPNPPKHSLRLLSAAGLPFPCPSFKSSLHLRALRAPEGGILYENPNAAIEGVELGGYASGILVSVAERRGGEGGTTGYVLAAYTEDRKRLFCKADLRYCQHFAVELQRYIALEVEGNAEERSAGC